jgi:phospholipid/cholesterol/gamma-HCH transport system substrate-binding protein
MSSRARAKLPRIVYGALAVAAVVVVVVLATGGGSGHRLWVTINEATGVLPGQVVRMAGQPVGEIASVTALDHGHRARIGLRIDDRAWPLTRGATMDLRWGGTISYLERYIEVTPGPRQAPSYADGGSFPASAFTIPVEFDSLVNDFTPKVRRDFHALLTRGGAAFAQAEPGFRATVARAPAAVTQASQLLTAIDNTGQTLSTLVSSTAGVIASVRGAQPTVEQLVSGAGQTLDVIGQHAASLEATLSRAPGTFAHVRDTLASANRTLDLVGSVTTRLAPGVTQLRDTVAPLDQLLRTIVQVGPVAQTTLRIAGSSAPAVTALLGRATQLMPQIDSDLTQAIPQLACIRPYSPDIVSLFTNWGGFLSSNDGRDFETRINPAEIAWAPTNIQAQTPAQAAALFPTLQDAFPRPPGEAAGQPWFQPQCGAGPNSLNPADDPEARPGSTFLIPPLQPIGLQP